MFVGYCVGNIIGPQTFIATEAPLYHSAYIAYVSHKIGYQSGRDALTLHDDDSILVGYCVKTVAVITLYIYMWSMNRKRDREAEQVDRDAEEIAATVGLTADQREKEAIERGMQDMTELDNKGFRYAL